MIQQFTTKKDIITGFANAMNLIEPTIQHHHERVSYFAYRLAKEMGMSGQQCQRVFIGALLHDIGNTVNHNNMSFSDLELTPYKASKVGASILKLLPSTTPFAESIRESITPLTPLKSIAGKLSATHQIGQIIYIADKTVHLLDDSQPVLNQIDSIKGTIHDTYEKKCSSDVIAAFDSVCAFEAVWMDMVYQPERFIDIIADNRYLSLDETVDLAEVMSKVIDFRSPFTAMHSAGVAATAVALAEKVGMSDDECKIMRIAGYLHDVGKMKIPSEILEKPGKLTDEEFNIMKEHAYYTYIILKDISGFKQVTEWAAFHHEKLHGKGYPFHYAKDELSLGSRIMTVADIFSALAEDRPYRKGMDKDRVISILREDTSKGALTDSIVELLISNYDEINERRDTESMAASKKYRESLSLIRAE